MTNDKNNPLDLASRLQQLRKQRGLSQEELAGQLGVSRQAVSKWESAQAQPELEKLLAAAVEDIWKYSTGNTCRSCIEWKEGRCSRPGPKDCGGYSWWKWRGFGENDPPRDPRSRFERLKACRTPTDMVLLLNGNERRFCPKAYGAKPDECEESCGRCIVQWLEEMEP